MPDAIFPVLATTPAAHWLSDPATTWDIFKFFVPLFLSVLAWAWRVESRISRHDMLLDRLTTAIEKIENTLEDWTDVKEKRAERMATIEAKIDVMIAQFTRGRDTR